jgi:succinate dehydrogenase / fumarate reductase membrane anchor subunit
MTGERRNEMRTPMRRVRGLGAAHSGTGKFWHQRVTAVAGIPLTIALIVIIIGLLGRSHAAVVQILGSPMIAIIMLLFVINMTYHMWIGMQEIVVDYVHEDKIKLATLMGNTFFCITVALASVFAILKLSFGV